MSELHSGGHAIMDIQVENFINLFKEIFARSTEAIQYYYMKVPIASEPAPKYRERVYCYELYHQLRTFSDRINFPFKMSGELDKSGHPVIYGTNLDNAKPDLVIHQPGDMGYNLVAIEVKPINASTKGIAKDLKRLTAFRRHPAHYQHAIFLVYSDEDDLGQDTDMFEKMRTSILRESKKFPDEIDLELMELYWHRLEGHSAEKQAW
jgi:hypothetical protein